MVQPKLIIHLDVNGTIMPADPVKSKHVKSMLNIHLSKQAFVRRMDDEDNEIVWWDGSPFHKGGHPPLLPQFRYTCHIQEHYKEELDGIQYPVDDSVFLEDYNSVHETKCDNFTSKNLPGSIYASELMNMMDTLEWKHTNVPPRVEDCLTLPVADGRRMNLFVPAFLELLHHLHMTNREFVIVIRTFGSDIPRLLPAFELIAQGEHPDLSIPGCISSPSGVGTLTRDDHSVFTLTIDTLTTNNTWEPQTYVGGDAILSYMESLPSRSVIMINDDYDVWRDHHFCPIFGKPVWLDLERTDTVRHFLLDDNVNINPSDSIACVWLRERNSQWKPLPLDTPAGKATIGTVLLQASLYFAILKRDAFVSELAKANTRYDSLSLRLR
jgi:hypothetical protein